MTVLFNCADRFDVLEVEWVPLDVLKLAIVFEVHPTSVTFCDIDRLFRHVLEIQDAGFNHLLGLEHVLLSGCGVWVGSMTIELCDQIQLILIDWFLPSGCLGQFLVGLEHMLKH